jgi:hypothetical protein
LAFTLAPEAKMNDDNFNLIAVYLK